MDDLDQFEGDPDFMRSLARGLRVIVGFSDRKVPMTIAELARITHLDRSVVRRCLYTLVSLGMVETHNNRYSLTPNILKLGHAYFSSNRIVERSQPYLDQLGNTIYTNCALALLSYHDVIYLSRFQNKRLIKQNVGLGSRLPAYCTSVGRVLLAGLNAAQLDEYLETETFRPYTDFTVTGKAELREIIEKTQGDGFSVVDQEFSPGLAAIAVPVDMGAVHPLLALSVTANSKYVPANQLVDMYLEKMRALALQLSRILL